MRVFSLNHHADYACRHSGACCTAGWRIPVERDRRHLLGAASLPQDVDGACRFYDRGSRRCSVHRDHGEAMMPSSCQHFPRRALIDDDGLFVTLSHYCPTAAVLLFDVADRLAIVESPPAFPPDRAWDALDARGHWPPLVSPGVMFDLESFRQFERRVVELLAGDESAEAALAAIAGLVEGLRRWHHRAGSFRSWLEREIHQTPTDSSLAALTVYDRFARIAAYDQVVRFVPRVHEAPHLDPKAERGWRDYASTAWPLFAGPIKRYLAAKAFGGWNAYQGRGARTLVAELIVSHAVLRAEAGRQCADAKRELDRPLLIEAIRAADWLLVHLVERQPFVDWLSEIEQQPA